MGISGTNTGQSGTDFVGIRGVTGVRGVSGTRYCENAHGCLWMKIWLAAGGNEL